MSLPISIAKRAPPSGPECGNGAAPPARRDGDNFYDAVPVDSGDEAVVATDAQFYVLLWLHAVQESAAFQLLMIAAILANAAVIGLETDYPHIIDWMPIEATFLVIFAADVLVKILTLGCRKFFDPEGEDILWNAFDFVIVSIGVLDFAMLWTPYKDPDGGHVTLLRIIRVR